jgi:hypothetical protein
VLRSRQVLAGDDFDMPLIPRFYMKSVGFIYARKASAPKDEGFLGVGFIATVSSSVSKLKKFYYFVTNEHVIRNLDSVIVRLEGYPKKSNFVLLSIPRRRFEIRKSLDLAIAPISTEEAIISTVPEEIFVFESDLKKRNIDVGDEIFMVSRILRDNMRYRERNVQIMRFGNISLIPQNEELFYLTETRSVSGHSGSPVFVYPTPYVHGFNRKPEHTFPPMLLGINRGHAIDYEQIIDMNTKKAHPIYVSRTNQAISHVVPAWYISDVLNCEKFKKQRRYAESRNTVGFGEIVED